MCETDSYLPSFKRKINGNCAYTYQLLLNGQDANSCKLTICLLSSDDNHLRVAVLSRQVNLCVGFLSNLENRRSNQTLTALIQKHQLSFKYTVPSWYSIHLSQLCFCGTAWRWGLKQKSCSPPEMRFCLKIMLDHTNINTYAKSFMIQSQSTITCKILFTISATIFCMNFAHFSTSVLGPLSWTMSLFCAGSGKLIMTWNK